MYNDDIEIQKADDIDFDYAVEEFYQLIESGDVSDAYDYAMERGFTQVATDKLISLVM